MKRFLSCTLALMMCISLFGVVAGAEGETIEYAYEFCPQGIDSSLYNLDIGDTYATYGATKLNPNWEFFAESTSNGGSNTGFNGMILSGSKAGEWFALKLKVPTKGTYSLALTYATHNSYNKGEAYLVPLGTAESNYFNSEYKLCDTPCNSSSGTVSTATATISKKLTVESDNQEFIFLLRRSTGYSAPVLIRRLVMTREAYPKPASEYIYQFRYAESGDSSLKDKAVSDTYTSYGNTALNENWKVAGEYWTSGKSTTAFNGLNVGSYHKSEWLALKLRVPTPGIYSLEYFYSTHSTYGVAELFLAPGNTGESDYFNATYKLADITHKTTSSNVAEASVKPIKIITTTKDNEELILIVRKSASNPDTVSMRRFVLTRLDPATLVRKFDFRPSGAVVGNVGVPDNYDTYESTGRNWKYLDMHEDVKTVYESNYAAFRTLFYGLSFVSTKKGHFAKLALNADFSGTYAVKLNHYLASNGANVADIYLAPISAADPTAEKYKLGTANMRASTEGYGAADLAIVNIEEGEYIFTAKVSNHAEGNVNMYLTSLELTPVTVEKASIAANKTMPINTAQSVSLITTVDGEEKLVSGATWTSTNESVASVRDDCIIRAHSDGDTVIKATFGDITATLPLTVTHPNARVEDATTAKVYITASSGVTLDVSGTVQGSQLDKSVGAEISASAPMSADGKDFKYWLNLSNGSVYSTASDISFKLASNTSLMAVYAEKANGCLVEFANANREIISSGYFAEGAAVVAPALPKLTGFGTAKEWSAYPETVTGDIQSIAIYDDADDVAITVVGGTADKSSYSYNDKVTVTATAAPEGQVFSHWTRGNQIVSYSETYSFYAWNDATLTANFASSALSNFPAVIIDDSTRTDGGNTAYMMELVSFGGKTILERGILFGASGLDLHGGATYKAISVLGADQFSAMTPESAATAVRAYVVYIDNGVIRIAYSAER